ncbi:aspartate aminotransferase family protein [Aestuariirhabdus sp. LZHN29]|uniref:aspartate aminotransferase family protein n=1 Tax=Aestuariirhabdus sp. LZHN29 TaxID=3417462 RepID=UPI003CE82F57
MPPTPQLISVEQCENLAISEVWKHYRRTINPGQVELISSFGFGQELIRSAKGCTLTTHQGKQILDVTGGIGVLNHGHNHPRILAARERFAAKDAMEVHKNYFSPYLAALSHNIAALLPGDLEISYLANSGAEAVEGAIKMAYKAHQGRRSVLLHSDISYHGKLLGAASASASAELHFRYPEIPGCHSFHYNDLDSVTSMVESHQKSDGSSDIYGIIIEPMSASTLQQCDENFLIRLRSLCDQQGIVLIYDEVFTGWGKTGELFHFMRYAQAERLLPDVLVTSKSLGGGKASLSAFVTRTPVFKTAYGNLRDALLHSSTYNGFGEECVTALEAINTLVDEGLVERAQTIGGQLEQGLEQLLQRYPEKISARRGCGALQGLALQGGPGLLASLIRLLPLSVANDERFLQKLITAAVIQELYQQHDILTYYADNREILLMAAPSLVISEEQLERYLSALDTTLAQSLSLLCLRFVQSKLFSRFIAPYRKPAVGEQLPDA